MLPIPPGCWLCAMPLAFAIHGLCSVCLRQLLVHPACCPRCGLPAGCSRHQCGRCLRRPPPWQRLIAVSAWQPPLSQLVNRLKFYRATALAVMLARLLLLRWLQQRRESGLQRPDLLLTVPLHHYRAWQRGYNQLEEIAQRLVRWCHAAMRHRPLRGYVRQKFSTGWARGRGVKTCAGLFVLKQRCGDIISLCLTMWSLPAVPQRKSAAFYWPMARPALRYGACAAPCRAAVMGVL